MTAFARVALKCQALVLLAVGRDQAALGVLSRWLQRWPDDRQALASRSHLLARLGRLPQALLDSHHLVALIGHSAQQQQQIQNQQVMARQNAAAWFNHGYLLEAAGRPEEALRAFGQASVLDPGLDRAWYGMGLALSRLGRLEEAETALKRNTELQPMSPHGWIELARVLVLRQQPEQARAIVQHLRGFEPQQARRLAQELGVAP